MHDWWCFPLSCLDVCYSPRYGYIRNSKDLGTYATEGTKIMFLLYRLAKMSYMSSTCLICFLFTLKVVMTPCLSFCISLHNSISDVQWVIMDAIMSLSHPLTRPEILCINQRGRFQRYTWNVCSLFENILYFIFS